MKKTIKILSLFTGCGGLDLGFEMAESRNHKFRVVWANDNIPSACATFRRNFSAPIIEEDVWKIDLNETPDFDLLLGGFPCQDFSVLSKRKGINVKRGMLYTRIVDALTAKKPMFFVAENVKGLLSANNGEAFDIIKKDFENAGPGYRLKYRLIRFHEYGVPQMRERVIIVGVKKGLDIDFKFPDPTHNGNYVTASEALKGVKKVEHNNTNQQIKPRTVEILKAIPPGGNYLDLPEHLKVKGLMSNIYRRLDPDRPSPTVIANGGGGTWGYHYSEPRSLTNRERARLQTFPDDFVFEGRIGEIRTQIGNAVPPLGAKVIAEALLDALEKNKKYSSQFGYKYSLEQQGTQATFL